MKAIYDKLRACLERQFSLCELVLDEDFQKQIVFFLMFISENEYLRGYVKNLVSNPIHYEKELQILEKEAKDVLEPVIKGVLQDIENLDNGDKKIKDFAKNSGHYLWLKGLEDCKKIKANADHYDCLIKPLIEKVLGKEPADYISPESDDLIGKCRKIRSKYNTLYSVSVQQAFVILSGFTWIPFDLKTFGLPEDAEIFCKIETERSHNIGEHIEAEANVLGTEQKRAICIKLVREKRNSMSIALKKLYYYLLDQLDTQLLNYELMMRYKTRCEWYSRDRLRGVIEREENNEKKNMQIENLLWPDMAEFLFAEGLYPIKMSMGNQIPDFVYLASPDSNVRIEPLVVECKVLPERISIKSKVIEKCKTGINQIIEAMSRSKQNVGYLVMYNLTEKVIMFPQDLVYNGRKIFIIDINISETPPSKKKGKAIIIERNDLLFEANQ